MLSNAEIDYLLRKRGMSRGLQKVLKHRIKRKLQRFGDIDLPAIQANPWSRELWLQVTGNVNPVNGNSNLVAENHDCSSLENRVKSSPGKGFEPLRPAWATGSQGQRITALPPRPGRGISTLLFMFSASS